MPSAQQIKAAYPGYAGWNDEAAIVADYLATGGQGKGNVPFALGGGGGTTGSSGGGGGLPQSSGDLVSLARQLQDLQRPFIEEAAQPLREGISDINDSYTKLLAQFKERAQTTSSRELGRRGVPLSSTSAQEFINQRTADSQLAGEAQRASQLTPLRAALSNVLVGGSPGNVLGSAVDLARLNESARQFDLGLENQQATGGSGSGGLSSLESLASSFFGTPSQSFSSPSGLSQQINFPDTPQGNFQRRVLTGQVGNPVVTTGGSSPSQSIFSRIGGFLGL